MKNKATLLIIFTFSLSFFSCVLYPLTNDFSCTLTGRVIDSSGQPVLGALVELTGEQKLVALSDGEGKFRLGDLKPGLYELRARVLGFAAQTVLWVILEPAQQLRMDVVLQELPLEVAAQQQAVDLSWLLRGKKRDILQSDSILYVDQPLAEASSPELRGRITAEMDLQQEIEGRRALLELGSGEEGDWQLQAGFRQLEGVSLVAFGSWQQQISSSHQLRLDFDYRDYFLGQGYAEGAKGWMASFGAANSWRIATPWLVNWSLNYHHYNALSESSYLSPRVEVQWAPQKDFSLRGAVAYRVRGPEASAYQELMGFLLNEGSFQPERSLSYEIGIEHLSQDNYLVSLTAYYDQVQHYLISLYLPQQQQVLSSNIGDAIVRGIQLGLTKSFLRSWQASLSYRWQQAVGEELRQANRLLQEIEGAEEALGFELSHQISTAVETLIEPTETRVKAMYRVNLAPLEEGGLSEGEMGFSSRFDLKVRQLLPQLGGASRWEVYLWLKNLLNQQQLNFFTLRENEPIGMPRRIVGGISIIF